MSSVGMGIDKILTIPIPFSILFNDSILYRFFLIKENTTVD